MEQFHIKYGRFIIYSILLTAIALAFFFANDADGQTAQQEKTIVEISQYYGVDPDLALSIAQVESNFNSHARGSKGEIGLFQLRPSFHPIHAASSDRTNIVYGIRYLAHCRNVCGGKYGGAWFVCFNRGENSKKLRDPKRTAYYQRVAALYIERKLGPNAHLERGLPYAAR